MISHLSTLVLFNATSDWMGNTGAGCFLKLCFIYATVTIQSFLSTHKNEMEMCYNTGLRRELL